MKVFGNPASWNYTWIILPKLIIIVEESAVLSKDII